MKTMLKRITMLAICFALCFLFIGGLSAQAAGWPTLSNIKTYPMSTGNDTPVYQTTTSTGRYGTIYANDLFTIVGSSGNRFKVVYPVTGGSGTKTGYVDKSAITPGTINVSISSFTATGSITAYRRASGSLTVGTITKGDNVYVIATLGSRSQVLYPLTGTCGYKMGWVNTSSIPKPTPASVNPIGCVDNAVSNAANQITLGGWTSYPAGANGSNQSLAVHVYVGGPAGSGAPVYGISADQYRSDVNKAIGVSGNHGFNTTITVDASRTGTQTLYFYAIGGSNPLIGTKTVTIKGGTANGSTYMLNGVPDFKQNDSRWSSIVINPNATTKKTIGQVGCTITSLAMAESYRTNTTITPATMKNKLSFAAKGNDLYWPSNYYVLSKSLNLTLLYNTINSGKPVLIGAKKPDGSSHWIVVVGYENANPLNLTTSMFRIIDPIRSNTSLATFFNTYSRFDRMMTY